MKFFIVNLIALFVMAELIASDSIDDWADSTLSKLGLYDFPSHKNGKYVDFAQKSVSLKPRDPQFGKAVNNAYEKAMVKIQEKYLLNL